jgi:MFS family permease
VRAYRHLFVLPAARRLALVMMPIRLGYAMAGLALVLLGTATTGSFTTGGAALGLFSLGAGALGPFRGRVVDRYGQTRPLLVYVPLFCLGFAVLPLLDQPWTLLLVSGVVGALSPPLLASSRPLWRAVVPDDLVRTAFAVDSISMQATMIAGPALTGAIAAAWSPQAAVWTVCVLVLTGGLAFIALPASRSWPVTDRPPAWATLVREPGIGPLLAVATLSGIALGSLVVVLPAASLGLATPLGSGSLLAALAVGSVIGGTWAGTRSRTDAAVAAARAWAGAAVAFLPVAWAVGDPGVALALMLVVVGLCLGPAAVYQLELVDRIAPAGTAVTAFAGIVALEGATVAIGALAAGRAVDADAPWAGILLALGCALGAALIYRLWRPRLLRPGRDQWAAASQSGPSPTETSSGTARS